jgi:hypothetical protein
MQQIWLYIGKIYYIELSNILSFFIFY